tara:strand:- start:10474 stop:10785 length:312 start_codon:yes stop_codon:yes gene_type:complete
MRKIESNMCRAVANRNNWANSNTQVTISAETNDANVYLHGNHIATVSNNEITLFDGGWQSVTTKSRLNALLETFTGLGRGLYQRNYEWFVQSNNNPFYNGMTV